VEKRRDPWGLMKGDGPTLKWTQEKCIGPSLSSAASFARVGRLP
jgi:hypothetical protein